MPEERFNQVLEFLQQKYPNRTTEQLFDLLEVIIGSSDILESVNYDKELAAQELIKRYGDAEDRGEIEAEQEGVSMSMERHPEFRDMVKKNNEGYGEDDQRPCFLRGQQYPPEEALHPGERDPGTRKAPLAGELDAAQPGPGGRRDAAFVVGGDGGEEVPDIFRRVFNHE